MTGEETVSHTSICRISHKSNPNQTRGDKSDLVALRRLQNLNVRLSIDHVDWVARRTELAGPCHIERRNLKQKFDPTFRNIFVRNFLNRLVFHVGLGY